VTDAWQSWVSHSAISHAYDGGFKNSDVSFVARSAGISLLGTQGVAILRQSPNVLIGGIGGVPVLVTWTKAARGGALPWWESAPLSAHVPAGWACLSALSRRGGDEVTLGKKFKHA
jgi:hypothetical protein